MEQKDTIRVKRRIKSLSVLTQSLLLITSNLVGLLALGKRPVKALVPPPPSSRVLASSTRHPAGSVNPSWKVPVVPTFCWRTLALRREIHLSSAISSQSASSTSPATTTTTTTMLLEQKTLSELHGQNVLLTGASGGLGRSLAVQIAQCAPKTLILSARKMAELQIVADECRALTTTTTTQIHILLCDLADPASVQALGEQALAKCSNNGGTIEFLINNGGVSSRSRFVDTDIAVDRQCMQINFLAGAALAKAVVPGMMAKKIPNSQTTKGRILWISSVQGLVGIPNRSSYAASKFAVQGYCESLRAEVASHGIRVHCASPGYIRTNLSRSALTGTVGAVHGQLDATTAAGADPDHVAANILNRAVANNAADFIVAADGAAVAAIWMRLLCPGLLRHLLVKRYIKSQKPDDGKEKSE